jgi:hypothetical protein
MTTIMFPDDTSSTKRTRAQRTKARHKRAMGFVQLKSGRWVSRHGLLCLRSRERVQRT